jgi:hypothetical protein
MKKYLFAFLFLIMSSSLFAQHGTFSDRSNDAFNELDGKLSLYFIDALTGKPINNGTVFIEYTGIFYTNEDGNTLFETEELNRVLWIRFEHEEYYTSEFQIEIMAGSIYFNRFSVSPKMRVGSIRIVLDWSDKPEDLDAHFVKVGSYHISYRNKRIAQDGSAKLDIDATHGFGPETITINTIDQNSQYYFFVEDYTNKGNSSNTYLAESKATIKIFDKTRGLIKVIPVSLDLIGDTWKVFSINNGEIFY